MNDALAPVRDAIAQLNAELDAAFSAGVACDLWMTPTRMVYEPGDYRYFSQVELDSLAGDGLRAVHDAAIALNAECARAFQAGANVNLDAIIFERDGRPYPQLALINRGPLKPGEQLYPRDRDDDGNAFRGELISGTNCLFRPPGYSGVHKKARIQEVIVGPPTQEGAA